METQSDYAVAQTNADKRRAWLQERQTGLGGSDAAVVLGLSPWKSRYELWAEKCGSLPPQEASDSPHLDLGRNLEAVVLRLLALKTGRVVEPAEPYKLVRHEEYDWLFCTPDGWEFDHVLCGGGVHPARGIVQAKTAFAMNRHDWDDEPPDYYRVQLQHEMLATGCSWGTLAVLFIDQGVLTRIVNAALNMDLPHTEYHGLNSTWVVPDGASVIANAIADTADFRFFDYDADTDFQADLLAAERAFLDLVDTQTPPSTDASESCRRAIQRLHPKDSGGEVILPAEWLERADFLAAWKDKRKEADEQISLLENELKALIGDATYGVLPDGSRFKWSVQARKEYVVAASEFRVLRREKAKGAKKDE